MKATRLLSLAIPLLVLASLPACSWDRRKALTPRDVTPPLAVHPESIVVYFEEVVAPHPLPETIWDNVEGPTWDVAESHQIGFTQQHPGGTRLVLPFGRSFTDVFESALQKAYPRHVTCFDHPCVERAVAHDGRAEVVRIKLDAFRAWEGPLNHLNFSVKGTCRRHDGDPAPQPEYRFAKEFREESLGGFFTTHMAMIDVMNDLLGRFSEELSVEIVTKGLG